MPPTIRKRIKNLVRKIISEKIDPTEVPPFDVSEPPAGMGDYSLNAAFVLTGTLKKSPADIATWIRDEMIKLDAEGMLEKVEVAGKGFVNVYLAQKFLLKELVEQSEREDFGASKVGNNEKVLLEFVSANPTGPLHIGHGRNAAVGDSIARILEWTGHKVVREYYINDAGRQIEELGRSVIAVACGEERDDLQYSGEYINRVVEELHGRGEKVPDDPVQAGKKAAEIILQWIVRDLDRFRVHMDTFVSESNDIRAKGLVEEALNELSAKGCTFTSDGALMFNAEKFGDENRACW